MSATPKQFIKYIPTKGAKPEMDSATIIDAGFRRRVDSATNEVTGNYVSLAMITAKKGDAVTARLHLTGGAKAITKRTLEQLGAKLDGTPQELAESLNGVETIVSIMPQTAIDTRTGAPAVDEQGKEIIAQPSVSIRTNDFDAGADFLAALNAEDESEG